MRTLQRAAEIVGDVELLAALMGVPWGDLLDWITGKGQAPTKAFRVAVEVVSNQENMATARVYEP